MDTEKTTPPPAASPPPAEKPAEGKPKRPRRDPTTVSDDELALRIAMREGGHPVDGFSDDDD